DRAAGERAVIARCRTRGSVRRREHGCERRGLRHRGGCARRSSCRQRIASGRDARSAAVPGVRGFSSAAALGADLVRARGVPRHHARARRSAAPRRLQRLRQPHGDRALPAAHLALHPLLGSDTFRLNHAGLKPRRIRITRTPPRAPQASKERERPNFFAGPYIDRRAEEREDPEWLAAARADPATSYLISQGTAQLLQSGAEPHIALLRNGSPLLAATEPGSEVLLGWFQGVRCILAELPPGRSFDLPADTQLAELRPLTAVLPA